MGSAYRIHLLCLLCLGSASFVHAQEESTLPTNILSIPANGFVTAEMVHKAVQYPGQPAARDMIDLLKADFHLGKAKYFLNRKKAGFMANERFDLAFERAIGDIRELTKVSDDAVRKSKAMETFENWQGAFRRAQRRDVPRI